MTLITKPDWLKNPDLWLPSVQTRSDVPFFSIPGNKVLTISPKMKGYSPTAMAGKGGITHFQDTSAPANIQLNWYYNFIFNNRGFAEGAPYKLHGITYEQIRSVVNTLTVTSFSMDEVAEGFWGMPFDCIEMTYFYQALKEKYANPQYNPNGYPLRHGGTYGSFASAGQWNYWNYLPGTDGVPKSPTDPLFKQYLQTKSKARQLSSYHFNTFAPMGIGTNIKNYIDRPDYCHIYYLKKFEMESVCFGYGRVGGVGDNGAGLVVYVDWPKIESLGNLYSALYFQSRRLEDPAGYIIGTTDQHPQVDYDFRVGCGFVMGYCLGDGWVQFDVPNRYGTNPKTMSSNQRWEPDTPGTPGPTQLPADTFTDGFPDDMYRGHDAGSEAAYYYSQMASTEGQPWKYVPYKYVGSDTWIMPSTDTGPDNGPTTTILEHAAANDGPYAYGAGKRRGRPDVMSRVKNGDCHFWAFDPSLPKGQNESIIVQVTPGKQEQITIQGMKLSPNYTTV